MPTLKHRYTRPALVVHGDIAALTRNLGTATGDGMVGSAAISDRNAKEAIVPVDRQEILRRAATLPIATWQYKDDPAGARHLGPMAQDFAAAFGVGHDDRSIHVVDAAGVSLAAVQALAQNMAEQQVEIARLRAELEALKGTRQADKPDIVA